MQPGYTFGAPAQVGGPGYYEFTYIEKNVIRRAALWVRAWGYCSIAAGVLLLVGGGVLLASMSVLLSMLASIPWITRGLLIGAAAGILPMAVVYVAGGVFYVQAGNGLSSATTAEGNDIARLMQGIRSLSRGMAVEVIAGVLAFAIGLAVGTAMTSSGGAP